MHLRYEINPPKLIKNNVLLDDYKIQDLLESINNNIYTITKKCSGIHITDSVLGIPRISPLILSSIIKNNCKNIGITTSLRIRDRNFTSITQYMYDSILLNIDGILLINGDKPLLESKDFDLSPSKVVKHFKQIGIMDKIDLFLSIPSNPDFDIIKNKIESEPTGFITQIVNEVEQVSTIVDNLKPQGFKIIPCILLPSSNNLKSALKLDFDWSNYQYRILDFIREVYDISKDMIITSPNDFVYAKNVIHNLLGL